jgi:dTDP-4-dehydrorhamnose reductase
MKRLLVTGGSSYLGRHLVPLAQAQQSQDGVQKWHVVHTYFSNPLPGLDGGRQLDVRQQGAVRALVDEVQPDVIIHTAGSNRPAQTMDQVIRRGAENVTEAAAACGARLIHLSTDVVFDGRNAPYTESDRPNPIHAYGAAKAASEETVSAYPDHVIVRTSLIYGLEEMDRGTGWVVEALRRGQNVTLFVDQMRNPVWVRALSEACLELAELDYRGILHVAGAQRLSRADFGRRMLDWWQVGNRDTLTFGPCDGTRWPLDCTLDISRARGLLKTPLPGVDELLSRGEEGLTK